MACYARHPTRSNASSMKKAKHSVPPHRQQDLLDNTAFLVMDVGRLLRRRFDVPMGALGLDRLEWYLVAHLCFFEGSTQQELADVLDVTKGGLAKAIDRLEHKGLVERRGANLNGRATKGIYLTEKGRPLALQVDAISVDTVSAMVAPLSPAQVRQLNELLTVLREGMLQSPAVVAKRRKKS